MTPTLRKATLRKGQRLRPIHPALAEREWGLRGDCVGDLLCSYRVLTDPSGTDRVDVQFESGATVWAPRPTNSRSSAIRPSGISTSNLPSAQACFFRKRTIAAGLASPAKRRAPLLDREYLARIEQVLRVQRRLHRAHHVERVGPVLGFEIGYFLLPDAMLAGAGAAHADGPQRQPLAERSPPGRSPTRRSCRSAATHGNCRRRHGRRLARSAPPRRGPPASPRRNRPAARSARRRRWRTPATPGRSPRLAQ